MPKINPTTLPKETKVEMIAIKGDQVFKKILPYGEALETKKLKGWTYIFYELGFSQFNNVTEK